MTVPRSTSSEITIDVRGHAASVNMAVAPLLKNVLQHTRHRFVAGGPLGHQRLKETVRHYVVAGNRLIFSAGLALRIQRHLERLGYAVEVDDRTHWGHLNGADQQVLRDPNLRCPERYFVAALSASPRGQIHLDRPSEIGRWIGLTARLFCQHDIFVVVRNRTDRDRLVAQIAEHMDRAVTSNPREAFRQRPRLLISTLQLARYAGGDDFQIIVAADTQSALSTATDGLPVRWPNATWYAFINGQRPLHEDERFHVEEVFGPIIFQPDKGTTDLDVAVVFIEMQRNARRGKRSGLTRKRHNYWHDADWNNAVATTAERLTSGENLDGVPGSGVYGDKPRVAILVESAEHGGELVKRLPQWELLTLNTDTSCIPAVGHQQIATFTYVGHWGIGADILIRADGGSGWPLTGGFPRQAQHQDDSVLVVDFNDTVDGAAVRDTGARHDAYGQLRWDDVAVENGQVDVGAQGDDPRPADDNIALDQPRLVAAQRGLIPAGQHVRT